MSLLVEGKRIFVTGGTRGLGAAICDVLAREAADVAFNYHENDPDAEAMAEKIKTHGRRALYFKVSITDRPGFKKLTREVVNMWGGIDALVNNAAINRCDAFDATTDLAWGEVIDTNLNSLFAVTKPFLQADAPPATRPHSERYFDQRDPLATSLGTLRDGESWYDRLYQRSRARRRTLRYHR